MGTGIPAHAWVELWSKGKNFTCRRSGTRGTDKELRRSRGDAFTFLVSMIFLLVGLVSADEKPGVFASTTIKVKYVYFVFRWSL